MPKLQDEQQSGVVVPQGTEPSVFSKIMRGEIARLKVYEDPWTCAFFPKEQLNLGHTLLVPKIQIDSFLELPEPYYTVLFQNSRKVGQAILDATGCARIGTLIHGFEVPHFHYHLIPMSTAADIWKIKPVPHTESELERMQTLIVAALRNRQTGRC